MTPKISIIMPMYGVEAYIGRAIESVLQQTFTDWELLIVNDGSKDNSRNIASEYAKRDNRIHIIDKPNGGLTSARLKGLEYAQGEYLSFADSDDTLHCRYLETLFDYIIKYDADVSMCSYNVIREDIIIPQSLYFYDKIKILEGEEIFKSYYIPQVPSIRRSSDYLPSFMWLRLYRRNLITNDLFVSERLVYQEDLVFSARIKNRLRRIVIINEPLYNYYVNKGSLTLKYRDNAWQMMTCLSDEIVVSLNGQVKEFIKEVSDHMLLSSVQFALRNAAKRDYSSFKQEYNNIRQLILENVRFAGFPIFRVKRSYMVLLFSLKTHCPYVLYKYNKRRV